MSETSSGSIPSRDRSLPRRLLWRLVKAEEHELAALLVSFAYLFVLFTGYALLRPVRDAMGITSGLDKLPALFWATFVAMLVVQPVYGWLASRFRRTTFLPWVYGFFILNQLGFFLWFHATVDHVWIARVFFVWLSVFNLFVVSVFWSFMADIFVPDQGKRLFGFIAAGASLGGLVGPLTAAWLAPVLGSMNLLIISMATLGIAIGCVLYLTHVHTRAAACTAGAATADANRPVGGRAWAGLALIARDPFLAGIGAFVFLLTWVSTFLYLDQAHLVARVFHDRDRQTQVFGLIDATVQGVALVMQIFAFGNLSLRVGMRWMLVSVPLLMIAMFGGLAMAPTLPVLVAAVVMRRVGQYAITRPSLQVLFTGMERDVKYKVKNLIDTVIYRGGDALSGSVFAGLGALGIATAGRMWAGAGIAAAWAALALWLGTRFERQVEPTAVPAPAAE